MENLISTEMTVPVYQIMALLAIMTIALLFGYLRLGVFFAYVFVFYWGNILNVRAIFNSSDPVVSTFSFMFMGFGLVIIFLATVGFLLNKE